MKKGKVLALLLTAALSMTTVPSAYAADFADDVVADTVETEDTELPAETRRSVSHSRNPFYYNISSIL